MKWLKWATLILLFGGLILLLLKDSRDISNQRLMSGKMRVAQFANPRGDTGWAVEQMGARANGTWDRISPVFLTQGEATVWIAVNDWRRIDK